jgi:hypothetical protein
VASAAAGSGLLTRRDRRVASLRSFLEWPLHRLQIRLQLRAEPLLGLQRCLHPVPLKLGGLARLALVTELALKLRAF